MSLFRPKAAQSQRASAVSLDEFGDLIGRGRGMSVRTRAGVSMGPRRALGLTAWYSGVRYIAEVTASLPVHTYRDRNGERARRADPPWLRRPDVDQVWFGLVEFWLMSLLHKGNAFSFKIRNQVGQVVGLREIHPDRVTTGVAPDGSKWFMVDDDPTMYTTRDVLHIPGLSWDGRFGLNPIQYAAEPLGAVAAADEYAARYYVAGNLGGIITVAEEMDAEKRARTLAEWQAFHEGIQNAHKTAVLGNGARYERISLNAKDAQLLESRQYGVVEVARLLRLPPHKLYDLSRATFSNIEHQSIEAITDGIQPWVERIEAHVNADLDLLPTGNFIEFNLEGRLRGDTASRFSAYSSAVGRPWMTPAEARRLENLPALDDEDSDKLLTPLNMGTAAALGTGALGGDPT